MARKRGKNSPSRRRDRKMHPQEEPPAPTPLAADTQGAQGAQVLLAAIPRAPEQA